MRLAHYRMPAGTSIAGVFTPDADEIDEPAPPAKRQAAAQRRANSRATGADRPWMQYRPGSIGRRVLRLLAAGRRDTVELVRATGYNCSALRRELREAEARGEVVRTRPLFGTAAHVWELSESMAAQIWSGEVNP